MVVRDAACAARPSSRQLGKAVLPLSLDLNPASQSPPHFFGEMVVVQFGSSVFAIRQVAGGGVQHVISALHVDDPSGGRGLPCRRVRLDVSEDRHVVAARC